MSAMHSLTSSLVDLRNILKVRSMHAGVVRQIDRRRTLCIATCHELARHRDRQKNSDERENHRTLPLRRARARSFHTPTADRLVKRLLVRHGIDLLVSRHHPGTNDPSAVI